MLRPLILTLLTAALCASAEAEAGKLSFLRPKRGTLDLDPRTGFFGYDKWKPVVTKTPADQLQRAGHPHCIAPWARCPDDRRYDGYYVGGGAARGGDERSYYREGTWGWDYTPRWSIVRLKWFHGRRHQAGEGQYDPDRKNDPLQDFTNP